jgi:FkbM family methyltransferase
MRRSLIDLYKQLFVRKSLVRFHQRLVNIGLWGLGILNSENEARSGEAHFLRSLPRFFRTDEDFVVFDVGANVGTYARLIKQLYPSALIFAFEPHPANFETLGQQAQQFDFRAFHLALSDTVGTTQLYDRIETGSTHASLYRDVIEQLHHETAISHPIAVTTLDQFTQEHQIDHIHLLKIDTEGSEWNILRGASRLLDARAIDVVQFEFNEMNVVSRVFIRDFQTILPNYTLFRMLPDGLMPISPDPIFLSEIFAYQNIVAVRE